MVFSTGAKMTIRYVATATILNLLLPAIAVVDYRLRISPTAFLKPACTTSGLICKSCTEISLCSKKGGEFNEIDIGTCGSDFPYCSNGQCVKTQATVCRPEYNTEFSCGSYGVFPDPADCHQYYFCVPQNPTNPTENVQLTRMTCTAGYGFNPRTGVCDIRLSNNRCSTTPPVPICIRLGQTGSVSGIPSMYYICKTVTFGGENYLYPAVSACENGRSYSISTRSCP